MEGKTQLQNDQKKGRSIGCVDSLSDREIEVLVWTAKGKTCFEISILLSVSINTVKAHIKNACKKMNAVNKTHAIAIAAANNISFALKLSEN